MKDKELKITESAVRAAMETCPTAREVLGKLFEGQLTEGITTGALFRHRSGDIYLVCSDGRLVRTKDGVFYGNRMVVQDGVLTGEHVKANMRPIAGKLTVEEDIPF